MEYVYNTHGTCSKKIELFLDGEIIRKVKINGGCSGNANGIATLVEGMNRRDVINKLKGIICKGRSTSCPDQLAAALEQCEYSIKAPSNK